ncbi:MAG TPA: DUF4363 family protein [Clostridiales bacterium]|nr:DUF4363 family protein [Clostridiales bacterium]
MKRFYICLAVIAIIVGVCIFSMHKVAEMRERVEAYANAVFTAVEEEDQEKILASVRELADYWEEEHQVIIRYIRHSQVEDISLGISKLEPLARYQAYPDLVTELNSIVWQVEQIWDSERFDLRNVL